MSEVNMFGLPEFPMHFFGHMHSDAACSCAQQAFLWATSHKFLPEKNSPRAAIKVDSVSQTERNLLFFVHTSLEKYTAFSQTLFYQSTTCFISSTLFLRFHIT